MSTLLFDNIEIQNFRAFEYFTIEQLGHVNLIVGRNNVGKSTLLEAIWLHANVGSPEIMRDILMGRDEFTDHRTEGMKPAGSRGPAVWSLFHGHPCLERISGTISIGRIKAPDSSLRISVGWFQEGTGAKGEAELVPVGGPDHGSGDADLIPALVIKLGSMQRVLRLDQDFEQHIRRWTLQPQSVLGLATNCVYVRPNGLATTEVEQMWRRVVLTDLQKEVVESLRIISPEVQDLAIIPDEAGAMTVRVRVDSEPHPVPLKSMGDGVNRLFGIGLAMVSAKGGLLLVDEVENGIHYSVMPEVWKFVLKLAKRLDVQVFATTHSKDCYESFQAATKGDQEVSGVLTRIERKKGELRASLFDETRLKTVVDENIEIR